MSARNREGWDTALDAQTDLVRSFKTVAGRAYMGGLINTLASAGMFDARTGELAPPNPEYASFIVGTAQQLLPECDPFYVSGDLSELIEYAAESFTPEALVPTDLIVPSGFAYFAQPLYMRDRFNMPMPFRAIQWCPTIDGGSVVSDNGQGVYGGVLVALYDHSKDGGGERVGGSDLAMDYVTTLRFNMESKVYNSDNSVRDMLAHLKVFFRLCQQTIAVPRHERVARPTWKRARATWKDIKEVVVFTLRRAKPPQYEGDEREVQWSHRWLVQGHWRNQWYGSEKVHRQIWIAPYVKGPDNMPLIFKRRAFELVR
ncbi:MAG: hypothetical protein ACJ780_10170 [Solirubrobacteraceae bacterium]|jgi:hypothetical protein